VDASLHRTTTLFDGETPIFFLELPNGRGLLLLSCPLQLNFHVNLARRFKITLK
jgi:hypothetical protein